MGNTGGNHPHPILDVIESQGRRMRWLARTTGYSRVYLSRVFYGHLPDTTPLRAACAKALGVPESDLFHTSTATNESGPTKAVA